MRLLGTGNVPKKKYKKNKKDLPRFGTEKRRPGASMGRWRSVAAVSFFFLFWNSSSSSFGSGSGLFLFPLFLTKKNDVFLLRPGT